MAKKNESSGVGGYLQNIVGQATNAVGAAAQQASGGGGGTNLLSSLLGPGFDPSKILATDPLAAEKAPPSVAELLLGTSMDVTGRYGQTGRDYAGALPIWAQGAAQKVAGSADPYNWDPYLGIVNQQGDERVYLGITDFKLPKDWAGTQVDTSDMSPRALEEKGRKDAEMAKKGSVKTDDTQTATQAKNQPYLWDQEKVTETMKKMRSSGILVKSFDDMVNVWGTMVDRAAATYSLSAGEKKLTPWDVLDMYKSEAKAAGSFTDYQSGSTRTTQRSVSEVTDGEAFSALQSKLSEMLGRDPSDQEVRDFAYRMNHLAAQNPAITKTITRYKNGDVVGSNSKTHGGFTADDVMQNAYEDAQNAPGYAEYQGATTYFNAAMSALGGMGEG